MRYCLFDSGDVVGPFSAGELLARKGFGAQSLVCPEEHSEEESYWKQAAYYKDFDFSAAAKVKSPTNKKTLIKKISTLKEIASRTRKAITGAKTEKPATAQEDITPLQLSKVDPEEAQLIPSAEKQEPTPSEKPVISARAQEAAEVQAAEPSTIPPLPVSSFETEKDTAALTQSGVEEKSVSQLSPIEEYFNTMQSGDLGNILGIPDPKTNSDLEFERVIKNQMEKTDPDAPKVAGKSNEGFDELVPDQPVTVDQAVVNPAVLDKQTEEKLKQNLKDLKETKSPVTQQQSHCQGSTEAEPADAVGQTQLVKGKPTVGSAARAVGGELYWLAVAGLVAVVLGGWLLMSYWHAVQPETRPATVAAKTVATAPRALPAQEAQLPAGPAVAALPVEEIKTPEEQAKEIVQTYTLDQNRGTVADYLAKRYANELAQGYTAAWAAEPLHKDVYVVKYRLAKSRKEPIMYVFQADTSKKKLTGALNNITLDLVGKINS